MSKDTTITIRTSKEVADWLATQAGTQTAGAQIAVETVKRAGDRTKFSLPEMAEALEALEYIQAYSKREMKGKITPAQWCYLADALNGTIVTPEFICNKQALAASVQDADDFDNLGQKWEVNVPNFVETILGLTGAETYTVFRHVHNFWNDENRDLEKWSETF